ncbi:hypothetical protein BD410DRAFT_797508 [Rickenella mellea]|uniref:Uncharacterized protein n=1 Tax=Rickenella mellea TaxID=50990 RepID=A0A4Y7PEP2_9AGAM|nr:hypothetical protein BD410DRAFT_797508 [Rickenella mellea]
MHTQLFTIIFFAFATLFSNVFGAPIETRDVFIPPILYPHAGTVWFVGQFHNVTWDTSNRPAQITNSIGMIVLAKGGIIVSGVGGLNHPLASNFSILDGRHEVHVPNVKPGKDYAVVLFGDSGNISPDFTIKK